MSYVFASLIILIASLVQGATSFGFSLIALPLLGILFELKIVVPTLVVFSVFLNLIILLKLRIKPNFKELGVLAFFAIICIPLGVQILLYIDEKTLKFIISILLIVISVIMMLGIKIKMKNKTFSYIIAGMLSGILNGAVSLSGPPIVVLLANDDKNKNEFRSSLTFLFLILNIVTVALYVKNDLFDNPALINMIYLLPVMIVGTYVGLLMGNKIDDQKFKKTVLVMLLVMGIMNLF